METLTAKILDYLKGQSFQVAVVFAAVLILTYLLRNRSAHIRYLLWLLVAIKCLTPPMMIFSVPVLPNNAPVPSPNIEYQPMPTDYQQTKNTVITVTPAEMQAPTENRESKIENSLTAYLNFTPTNILISVWAAGGAFYLLWAATKAIRLQLWLKQFRRPLPPELMVEQIEMLSRLWDRPDGFTVWLLDGISQPFVWGLWRGAIYLPGRIQGVQTDRQKAVVMHEMAHVVRLDAFINLMQILIQGLFWFHPLVWLANRFIRQEREKCCDETAIARLNTHPKEYGSAIIETLVQEYHNAIPIPSLAVAGPIKNIEDRIKTIMQPGRRFFRRPSIIALLIIGALAAVIAPTTIALTQKNTPPNHTVTGTVTDAQTGAPIAGAEVFDDGYNDNKGRTTTGDDGKFELKTWNEEHFISAGAKGYESHKQLLKTFPFANNKNFNFQLKKITSATGIPLPMTITFKKNLPLRDALQMVGKMYKKNIIPSDKITGTVPVTDLYNITSVEQALQAILGTNKYVVDGNFIRVYTEDEFNSLQPALSPFIAALPDGVTVELLGICEHPSKGKRWWKPDGTFLEQPPYNSDQVKAKVSDGFKPEYEFAVLVENPSGKDVGFEEFKIHDSGSSSVGSFPRGNHSRLNWFITSLPQSLVLTDVKVKIADTWVTFKHVSLKPDLKTDVKIEIEKPAVGVVMTPWEMLLKEKENVIYFIDFDTRQIATQVYGINLKDEESVKKWARDNRYDAVVKFGEHPQLIGYDTAYLLIGPDEWEDMSAVYIDELAKQKQLDAVPYHNGQKEYVKYAIRTREGAIGWLRMATIDDRHPQSMVFKFNKLDDEYAKTKLAAFRKEQGIARLSFHILPNKEAAGQYSPMLSQEQIADYRMQLRTNGPAYGATQKDVYRWLKSDHPQRPLPSEAITEEYSGMRYVLVCNWRPRAMLSGSQYPENWGLTKVEMETDTLGHPAIRFELDEVGQEQMAMITGQADHIGRSMAIVLNGNVIAAPRIQSKLSKQGMIVGSFTEDEVRQIVDLLKTSPQYKPSEKEKPGVKTETNLSSASVQSSIETQNSKFTATLPDGVTVELLGICEDVSKNNWWRPDGTVFTPEKFVLKENGVCTASMPYRDRIFLAKITGPDGMNYGFGKILGSKGTLSLKIEDSSGNSIPDLFADKVHLDTSYELTEVTVRVTAGAWKTIATRTPGGGVSAQGTDNYGITFAGAIEKDGKIIVTASDDLVDMDHRIVAVDKEGKEHVGPQPWSSAGKTRLTTAEFKDLNLNQVKEFQFRVRPYQQVEFKNVSLKPGLKTDVKIETYKPQNKTGQEQSKAMAIFDNPKFKKRFFMTIVADKDNQISGDGRKTTFEELDAIMPKNPDPSHTVLEVAFEPGAFPDIRTQYAQNPVFQKAGQLVEKYHLECLSYVGEDHPENRRGPLSIRTEDVFVMDKDIAVAMPALSLQEDKPLLTADTIRFAGGDPVLAAKLDLTVISHPKRQWEIKARLLDKDGGQLDSVVKYYQNSGVIAGTAAISKDMLDFNFGQVNIAAIAKFEIELRQMQSIAEGPQKKIVIQPDTANPKPEFTAALPNGVSVELIGLCEYPSKGKQWWKPDGSSLEQQIVTKDSSRYEDKNKAYEIAYKISLPQGAAMDMLPKTNGSTSQSGIEVTSPDGLKAIRAHLNLWGITTTVSFPVAAGPWKTLGSTNGQGQDYTNAGKRKLMFSPATGSRDKFTLTVSDDLEQFDDYRLIAVDKKEIVHTANRQWFSHKNLRQSTFTFTGLDPESVDRYEFQTRPFSNIEFKNVSLKAGKKTSVKIEIPTELKAPLQPGQKTEAKIETQNSGDFRKSFRTVTGIVKDYKGRPAGGGVKVSALPMTDAFVYTDNDGRFIINWSEQWEPSSRLRLMAQDTKRKLAKIIDITPQTPTVEISLEPAIDIRGTIVDKNEKAVPEASIMPRLVNTIKGKGWADCFMAVRASKTDGNGSFLIEALPANEYYSLCVRADGYKYRSRWENGGQDAALDINTSQTKTNVIVPPIILEKEERPLQPGQKTEAKIETQRSVAAVVTADTNSDPNQPHITIETAILFLLCSEAPAAWFTENPLQIGKMVAAKVNSSGLKKYLEPISLDQLRLDLIDSASVDVVSHPLPQNQVSSKFTLHTNQLRLPKLVTSNGQLNSLKMPEALDTEQQIESLASGIIYSIVPIVDTQNDKINLKFCLRYFAKNGPDKQTKPDTKDSETPNFRIMEFPAYIAVPNGKTVMLYGPAYTDKDNKTGKKIFVQTLLEIKPTLISSRDKWNSNNNTARPGQKTEVKIETQNSGGGINQSN
jgi:beta-lactamase regulating signal transducer with metallopeptidase domain